MSSASDNETNLCEGTYGDGLGNGPDFNIKSRGSHPEWYLFRIPDIDTYLPKDHNLQIPTMTPILTNDELFEIYTKALEYKDNYYKRFKKQRPNLMIMKQLYDIAINPTPDILLKEVNNEEDVLLQKELQQIANSSAVEKLKYI